MGPECGRPGAVWRVPGLLRRGGGLLGLFQLGVGVGGGAQGPTSGSREICQGPGVPRGDVAGFRNKGSSYRGRRLFGGREFSLAGPESLKGQIIGVLGVL